MEMLDLLRLQVGNDIVIETEPGEAAEILIDGRPTEEMLKYCPKLRAVVVPFAGVPVATEQLLRDYPNIALHNLHHNASDTAEMAMALLFSAAKRIVQGDQGLRKGDWSLRYSPIETLALSGATVLVLGYGEIGKRISKACIALEMTVHATRRTAHIGNQDETILLHPASSLRELLPFANFLIIALPQTPETEGLIGAQELALLPKDAVLVNVARAQIVNEKALFEALKSKRLHSAGLDVWYRYPDTTGPVGGVPGYFEVPDTAQHTFPSELPFHKLDNVVLSPHRGGASRESEQRRIEKLAELLKQAAAGKPMANRVNLDFGY